MPGTGRPDAHRYRVEVANPLVVDGLVLLEEDAGAYRFLDTNRVPLTVRDLRRFRVLVKVSEAQPGRPRSDRRRVAAVVAGPRRPARRRPRQRPAGRGRLRDRRDHRGGGHHVRRGFTVGYRDAGTTSTLFASRSFAQARAVFLDEACWLGAERGRGPYVGRDQAVGTEEWTVAMVVAAYERRLLEGP